MSFCIGFTGDFADYDSSVAVGKIRLGDYCEAFHAELGFWVIEDYEKSWETALNRLVDGTSTSCLVASLTDPQTSNFVVTWPLYRSGDEVYIQNRYLFLEQLEHDFDPAAPWESVSPRSVVNEDGDQISEWQVRVADVRAFLKKKKWIHGMEPK